MPKDRRPFRVLMISTTAVGVAHWRLWQFAKIFNRTPGVEVACFVEDYNWQDGLAEWEGLGQMDFDNRIEGNPLGDDRAGLVLRRNLDQLWGGADAVVCQLVHTPFSSSFVETMKDKWSAKFFTEVDDYLFETPSWNLASKSYAPGSLLEKIGADQMRISDGIITTTSYLKGLYSHLNENIHIIPNSLDLPEWDRAYMGRRKADGLRIGWCGGAGHDEDLKPVLPAIRKVTREHGAHFLCIKTGAPFFRTDKRMRLENRWLPTHKFPMSLAKEGFDIGIAPLEDSNFNRAKSNLKWLEYSALGIPCVASKVEPYARSIRHGETGFLAETHAEWVEYLTLLAKDPKQRRRMGQRARRFVRKYFGLEKAAAKYLRVLRGNLVKTPPD